MNRLDPKKMDEVTPALWVIRHLLARCHKAIGEHMKKLFCSQLKTIADIPDYEVRFAIIEIILALVTNNQLFREEDQQFFLQYLLKQVATHPQEIAESVNFVVVY